MVRERRGAGVKKKKTPQKRKTHLPILICTRYKLNVFKITDIFIHAAANSPENDWNHSRGLQIFHLFALQ